ncbi:hypothetical protein SAMN05216516_107105 [Izhakiella capsodis]|uniref:Uncharacterized protein n=1 Tax=Izhakiella capsodis TaxID=1367852 RepID=A0A1I4YZW4_9GAMM|nr:hypothetical protein SAMN05216516_107105 [Izhakiella capsodis]
MQSTQFDVCFDKRASAYLSVPGSNMTAGFFYQNAGCLSCVLKKALCNMTERLYTENGLIPDNTSLLLQIVLTL